MESQVSSEIIKEIEENIPTNVKKVRAVLEGEHNVIIPNQCDQFIARCLRQKDGNIDKAIKLILAYQDTISTLRQWELPLLPGLVRDVYETGISLPLKHKDPKGRYVVILRIGLWDPQMTSFEQATAFLWMISQYNHSERIDVQRDGFMTIWDYKCFSLQQALAAKPVKLLTLVKWAKNGVGGRFKELHLVNLPKVAQMLFKAIRPFLSDKLKTRIIIHDSTESLLKHVDGKYLPTTIGGDLDPEKCTDTNLMNTFFESDKYFKDMMDVGFPCK